MIGSPGQATKRIRQAFNASIVLATVAALLVLLDTFSPVGLSYNRSVSLPLGLYWHQPATKPLKQGQVVCFRYVAPEWAKPRHYFPEGTLLCKHILGVAGDRIMVTHSEIAVCEANRCASAGAPLESDKQGRPLLKAELPDLIPPGMLYLTSTRVPNSFDSRYLGLIAADAIVREAHPLWVQE